jgi:hypothetical protein
MGTQTSGLHRNAAEDQGGTGMIQPTEEQLEKIINILVNARDAALLDKFCMHVGVDHVDQSVVYHLQAIAKLLGLELVERHPSEPTSASDDESVDKIAGLRPGARAALIDAGLDTFGKIRAASSVQLLRLPNFGRRAFELVRKATAKTGENYSEEHSAEQIAGPR